MRNAAAAAAADMKSKLYEKSGGARYLAVEARSKWPGAIVTTFLRISAGSVDDLGKKDKCTHNAS